MIGSGARGLSAAVTDASRGLSVMLVENEPLFGGITAWSGGRMWIPGNRLTFATNYRDQIAAARKYLIRELGDAGFDQLEAKIKDKIKAKIDAYLDDGSRWAQR